MLIDSHCHLDRLKLLPDSTLSDAISAARLRGVEAMLCVGISRENRKAVVDIAEEFEGIYASVGVHPSDVGESVELESELGDWLQASVKIVAIGETGLDYHYGKDDAERQRESFGRHLRVAKAQGYPVIVHTREAQDDTLDLIRSHGAEGVLHCFTESWDMAKKALDLGYYISLSGIVTFKNAESLRDVARQVPMDRLLVETDSPYLAPVPHRGKPNEPKYVREVAEFIADLRGMAFEELAAQTTENFFNLFRRAQRPG